MVYCVAYNCSTRSGQGISMFKFPKEEKRRKAWITRVKRKNFVPSECARLCAKHFTYDQYVVSPLLATSIGYKVKNLRLKIDAEPTVFNFSQPECSPKRKAKRQSGAISKRQRIETLTQIFEDKTDESTSTQEESSYVEFDNGAEAFIHRNSDELATLSKTPQTKQPTQESYHIAVQTLSNWGKKTIATQTESVLWKSKDGADELPSVKQVKETRCLSTDDEEEYLTDEELYNSNDPDWVPNEDVVHVENSNFEHVSPAKERKFIVFECMLDLLLTQVCIYCGETKTIVSKHSVGTGLCVKLDCNCDHQSFWNSQPMSGKMPLGNLIIAGAIFFAGCCVSKVLTSYEHAGIQCFGERSYHKLQNAYLHQTVTDVWHRQQDTLIQEVKTHGHPLNIGGDARCCSPGHTAKYGSYSVMDCDNNKVLDLQLVQCNEVANSYAMELEGLKRCLTFLEKNDVVVQSIVTDRHSQIKKYLREKRPDVDHLFDVWHVAKGVYKKLEATGKKKGLGIVGRWARSISNHMYWCAASSNGDGEMVQQKWFSILNHVANIHNGHGSKFQQCAHGDLEDREWFNKGSKAFIEIEKIIKGKLLSTDIMKLSPSHQTSSLEAFHSVVCFFAPKFLHYFHASMETRLYLAVLHYNENATRSQAMTKKGTPQYRVSFPKSRKGHGVVRETKTHITYGYVDDLMAELLAKREQHKSVYEAIQTRKQNDQQRPLPMTHTMTVPRPIKEDIIHQHVSRFNKR